MPHMVIFRSAEGKPGYHQAETLDDAVRFVERLRNQEQIPEMRIFRMQEVPIEFKPYYRVEVMAAAEEPKVMAPPAVEESPAPPVLQPAAAPAAPAAPEEAALVAAPAAPPVTEPVTGPQNNGGGAARFGRFNRG